ncbi:MAG: hypothetical protein HQK89_03420 [Nitrospirae bacterium]|nr:hypothetical protein [Nitrospirota bacterium]
MDQKDYEANLETAMAYLRQGNKNDALSTIQMALSQVPENEKLPENIPYLRILYFSARFAIESGDYNRSSTLVHEGLKLNKLYPDLLFLDVLLSKLFHRYGEMLSSLLSFLISIDLPEHAGVEYEFVNDTALHEVLETYLPLAYGNTQNHAPIKEVVLNTMDKLRGITTGQYLQKAYNIMSAMDNKNN